MKSLFLIGGGGHCRSVIDVIESGNQFKIQGIFDLAENVGKEVLGYKIIGTDQDIKKYIVNENYFLVTIGQIKNVIPRKNAFLNLKSLDAKLATIISHRAYVSKHAKVEVGTIVMHDSLINCNALVGENCIINTKSLIEHDVIIKENVHVSTGAIVNGGCIIEEDSFIGSNAVLKECVVVVKNAIIKAGSFYNGK